MKFILLVIVISIVSFDSFAQTDSSKCESSFNVTASLISNYVWRTVANVSFMNANF